MFRVWRCYGLLWTLHCHKVRYYVITMIWPLLFHGIRVDMSETPNKALTTRMHGDYRPSSDRLFVGFKAIFYAFLRNNPIYIEGRNCSFSTAPVLFNKCKGLRPSNTLSSWWLGWRRDARVRKPFFDKSLDLLFQSFTIVMLTIYLYWIKEYCVVTWYGQADVPREVSGRGRPAVRPAAPDFPRDICLTVSRKHAVFLSYWQIL